MLKPFMRWRDRRSIFTAVELPSDILTGRLFAIGSCFARNVVTVLKNRDVDARLSTSGLFYTPGTMAEYVRALAGPTPPIHVLGQGSRCYSPEMESRMDGTEQFLRQEYERQVTADRSWLTSADNIVFTLGLTEQILVHWDGKELLCRQLPPAIIQRQFPNQIAMRVWSVADIKQSLEEIVSAVQQLNPRANLLFTISPVPLDATFQAVDIRIANSRSKYSLYAGLHEFMGQREGIYYFPSFEYAQILQQTTRLWEDDGRHVSVTGVQNLMTYFATHGGEESGLKYSRPSLSIYMLKHSLNSKISRGLRRLKRHI